MSRRRRESRPSACAPMFFRVVSTDDSFSSSPGRRRDMGAVIKKPPEQEDPRTGLTASDRRLLREIWHHYVLDNRDYGVLIFVSFFLRSPESLQLFPRFCKLPVGQLPTDPQFRAHAFAVGYQLTSMVDSTEDPELLEALIRKNAMAHTERVGVMPDHFRMLGEAVIGVLRAMNERRMNKEAVHAWEKLFAYMHKITTKTYEEENMQINPVADSSGNQQKSGKQRLTREASSAQRSGSRTPNKSKSSAKAGSKSGSRLSTPKQTSSQIKQASSASPKAVKPSQSPNTTT